MGKKLTRLSTDPIQQLHFLGNRNIPRNKLLRDTLLITNRAARRLRAATDPKVKSGTFGKAYLEK